MKKNLFLMTLGFFGLLAFDAAAQAPASFRGDAIFQTITSGDGTVFDPSGYSLVLVANNANSYQRFDVNTGAAGSGTFTYNQAVANAMLTVHDSAAGVFSSDYTFNDATSGTFSFNQVSSSAFQSGSFILFSGQAPISLAGNTFYGAILNGTTSAGSWVNTLGVSSLTGVFTNSDGSTENVNGTYTATKVNNSCFKIVSPGSSGAQTFYFAFTDSQNGYYFKTTPASKWQVGTFTMQAAPDTTRPSVTITTPVANAHLSNQVAVVSGKASDNVAVANVFVSADGVNWLTATGTTNWTAMVNLVPGANNLWAYAVDGSGNVSPTNKVNVTYIVSGSLTVNINGRGSITPNYTNATLQISNRYSITAVPAAGFSFANWTDGGGNYITNKTALNFLMADGLVFDANFLDTQKPTLSITNIPSNGHVSNDTFTVSGKAGDNVGVVNVFYNLNNAGYINTGINTGNNFTNWNVGLALVPGVNTIAAYAQDAAGNISATNTVKLTYILSAPLTVRTNGRGTIAPNYNNAYLQISNRYTLTATPAAGFGFTGWTDESDTLVSTNKILSFTMASNLTFVANFVDTQKPKVTILTPTAMTSASSEMFTARGTAGDNVGVQTVFFKFNQLDWFAASTTNLNYYTNWYEVVQLVPGTNYFAAYAVDAAGNVSPTNTVKFLYTTAPASLSGLIGGITPASLTPAANAIAVGGNPPSQFVAFGATTFSQWAGDTNAGDNGVGNYTYTKQTPSSGQLKITYTAPPSATNATGAQTIHLTFTASDVATFTNLTTTDTGGIMFTSTPTLAPASFVGQTVYAVNSQGADKLRFTANQIISINSQQFTNHIRNYTYAGYSPVGGLIRQTGSNYLSYVVVTFARTNTGGAYSEQYDASNNLAGVDLSVFGLASQRPGGNAPTNLVNRTLVVTTDTAANQLNFPDSVNFTDVNPQDNSIFNGSGTYLYGPVSTNSASLNLNYSGSPAVQYDFLFVSPNFAIFTNRVDSTLGSAVLK